MILFCLFSYLSQLAVCEVFTHRGPAEMMATYTLVLRVIMFWKVHYKGDLIRYVPFSCHEVTTSFLRLIKIHTTCIQRSSATTTISDAYLCCVFRSVVSALEYLSFSTVAGLSSYVACPLPVDHANFRSCVDN